MTVSGRRMSEAMWIGAGDAGLAATGALLGGKRVLRRSLSSPLDAHDLLLQGLPGDALMHLLDSLVSLRRTESLEKAVGMSLRTFQRRRDSPARPLTLEQSGRTWKFAEILANATAVFGSQKAAEERCRTC